MKGRGENVAGGARVHVHVVVVCVCVVVVVSECLKTKLLCDSL